MKLSNDRQYVDVTFCFPTDTTKIFGRGNASYQQRIREGSSGIDFV